MTQRLIRAYTVQCELAFIEQYFDEGTRERAMDQIPQAVREEIGQLKPVDWCPVDYASYVLNAIASVKNDPEGSFADIVECGKSISKEASNTFYKLMLNVVTPEVFLKKLDQTFWGRDFKGVGSWDIQIAESGDRAKLELSDVKGLDHIGPLNEGFMRFIFGAMGYENVSCETKGWSLAEPGPEVIQYEVTWS